MFAGLRRSEESPETSSSLDDRIDPQSTQQTIVTRSAPWPELWSMQNHAKSDMTTYAQT